MKKTTTTSAYDELYAAYAQHFDISSLSSPNDIANLRAFISIQVALNSLQNELELQTGSNILANMDNIQRITLAIEKMIGNALQLERALAIDRKTRSKDQAETVAEYIQQIKLAAVEYMNEQYIQAYCPDCKILVGRIIPALEHTAYTCKFQCSQCRGTITVKREEKDIFFDFAPNDREWRRKHKYEVIKPVYVDAPTITTDADLFISDEVPTLIDDSIIDGEASIIEEDE